MDETDAYFVKSKNALSKTKTEAANISEECDDKSGESISGGRMHPENECYSIYFNTGNSTSEINNNLGGAHAPRCNTKTDNLSLADILSKSSVAAASGNTTKGEFAKFIYVFFLAICIVYIVHLCC